MGIVGIVAVLMAAVGFITFGFTQTVCGDQALRIRGGEANNGSLVINGYAYDFSRFEHPAILPYFNGTTNPLYSDEWQAGGKDASFLFQNVNQKCKGIITPAAGSAIISSGDNMAWYFPCNLHDQNGTSAINITGYELDTNCHRTAKARSSFGAERPAGQVYYTWDMVKNPQRNLAVYKSYALGV
jgi:chitin synthase